MTRRSPSDEQGYSLIELLVVVLIVGILAAIAIAAYLTQQAKAHDAEAKSAARTAQTAMETCSVPTDDGYVGCHVGALRAIEPTLTDADLTVSDLGEKTYRVAVRQDQTGHVFSVRRETDGTVTRTDDNGDPW